MDGISKMQNKNCALINKSIEWRSKEMKTWKVTVFSVEYTKERVQMKSLKTNYTWIHFDNEEIVKVIHDIRPGI